MKKKLSCGLLALTMAFNSAPALLNGSVSNIGAVDVFAATTGTGTVLTLSVTSSGIALAGSSASIEISPDGEIPALSNAVATTTKTVSSDFTGAFTDVTLLEGEIYNVKVTVGDAVYVGTSGAAVGNGATELTIGVEAQVLTEYTLTSNTGEVESNEEATFTIVGEDQKGFVMDLNDTTGISLTVQKNGSSATESSSGDYETTTSIALSDKTVTAGITFYEDDDYTIQATSGSDSTLVTSNEVSITVDTGTGTQLTDITGFTLTGDFSGTVTYDDSTTSYNVSVNDDGTKLTLGVASATAATYKLGDAEAVNITDKTGVATHEISLSGLVAGTPQNLVITAGSESITFVLTKASSLTPPSLPTEYTITFNVDGGTAIAGALTGSDGTLTTLTDAEKTSTAYASFTFKEWNTKADGTGDVVTTDTAFEGDTTIYAIFDEEAIKYEVTVNSVANGDTYAYIDSDGKETSLIAGTATDIAAGEYTFVAYDASGKIIATCSEEILQVETITLVAIVYAVGDVEETVTAPNVADLVDVTVSKVEVDANDVAVAMSGSAYTYAVDSSGVDVSDKVATLLADAGTTVTPEFDYIDYSNTALVAGIETAITTAVSGLGSLGSTPLILDANLVLSNSSEDGVTISGGIDFGGSGLKVTLTMANYNAETTKLYHITESLDVTPITGVVYDNTNKTVTFYMSSFSYVAAIDEEIEEEADTISYTVNVTGLPVNTDSYGMWIYEGNDEVSHNPATSSKSGEPETVTMTITNVDLTEGTKYKVIVQNSDDRTFPIKYEFTAEDGTQSGYNTLDIPVSEDGSYVVGAASITVEENTTSTSALAGLTSALSGATSAPTTLNGFLDLKSGKSIDTSGNFASFELTGSLADVVEVTFSDYTLPSNFAVIHVTGNDYNVYYSSTSYGNNVYNALGGSNSSATGVKVTGASSSTLKMEYLTEFSPFVIVPLYTPGTSSSQVSSGGSTGGGTYNAASYYDSGSVRVNGTVISELQNVLVGELVNLDLITTVNGREVLGWFYDSALTDQITNTSQFIITSDIIANGLFVKLAGASDTLVDGSTNAGAGTTTDTYVPSNVPSTIAKLLGKLF